jgi:hypothetical protein
VVESILKIIIEGIFDAIEEFFEALTVPTRSYTLDAFFVSIVFLGWSIVAWLFELFSFVNWQEALTCTILLGIIVLIDSSTRSTIKSNLAKVKSVTSRFSYTGETEEEINEEDVENESGD